jgi:hypothetical protein
MIGRAAGFTIINPKSSPVLNHQSSITSPPMRRLLVYALSSLGTVSSVSSVIFCSKPIRSQITRPRHDGILFSRDLFRSLFGALVIGTSILTRL